MDIVEKLRYAEHVLDERVQRVMDEGADEIERLRSEKESFEQALLLVRKALCGDIHNQDDILEIGKALRQDAERYRWLLEQLQKAYDVASIDFEDPFLSISCSMVSRFKQYRNMEAGIRFCDQSDGAVDLNSAIDAAMGKTHNDQLSAGQSPVAPT